LKTVRLDQFGDPALVLYATDAPVPSPGQGQALVRMRARPINPTDRSSIQGGYPLDWVRERRLPATPGMEGTGVVEALGPAAAGVSVGQRVVVFYEVAGSGGAGTWQEYAAYRADALIPVPDTVDEEVAAQLFINPMSAYLMLVELALAPGAWLVLTAAGSGVGVTALQVSARRGLRTIATCRRREQAPVLAALGATRVVCTEDEPLRQAILEATGGAGASAALDAVGGEVLADVTAALSPGGRVITYGNLSGQRSRPAEGGAARGDVRVEGFWLTAWIRRNPRARLTALLDEVVGLAAAGALRLPVDSRHGLSEVKEAVRRSAQPARAGKVLLVG
jgi:NADPH:quinone reductase-like Zn-dependent oxidoreductase